ncbi:MAG: hypothetical protein EOO65_04965 [Methanosarcinales archaeon]|nr:MAG: hypothetical protein EOO65_04965 [Methanosarcinales archaeon]
MLTDEQVDEAIAGASGISGARTVRCATCDGAGAE